MLNKPDLAYIGQDDGEMLEESAQRGLFEESRFDRIMKTVVVGAGFLVVIGFFWVIFHSEKIFPPQ